MKIAGFDIGGANTDLAIIDFKNGDFKDIQTDFEYLPMWSKNEDLGETLIRLIENICPLNEIDAVGISMTAELVDAYETKKDGVLDVVKKCEDVFDIPLGFVGVDGMLNSEKIKQNPIKAAAANWIATAEIAGMMEKDCIFIDTGSTTTDIIPVKNGSECAKGRSDFERLSTGELVYTGTLRTNLTSFLDKIPFDGSEYRVASELFAITADVYTVLDLISPEDYVCDTCDGQGKSKEESMRRISRVLCADLEILSEEDIIKISDFIYQAQVAQIANALDEVASRENLDLVITTGLGKDILGYEAASSLDLRVKPMNTLLSDEECVVAPAIGTAIMMNKFIN